MESEVDWLVVVACEEVWRVPDDTARLAGDGGYYYHGSADGDGWGDGVFYGDTDGSNMPKEHYIEGSYVFGEGGGVPWYRR